MYSSYVLKLYLIYLNKIKDVEIQLEDQICILLNIEKLYSKHVGFYLTQIQINTCFHQINTSIQINTL